MKHTLHAGSFFLVRTPTLPLDELLEANAHIANAGLTGLADRMRQVYGQELMREAIYLASPELYAETERWLNGEKSSPDKVERLLYSLYKYYLRMTSRSTPYGLFAGCATGTITHQPSAIRFADTKLRKHVRLDMNYVAELASTLVRQPAIRSQLRFLPNNSLYQIGDQYRYVEYKLRNKNRSYLLAGVRASAYVSRVVEAAQGGKTIDQLAQMLVSDTIRLDQATAFVNQLIDSQILTSELEPTVTGPEFFGVLLDRLRQLDGTDELVEQLSNVKALLNGSDSPISRYLFIKDVVDRLTATQSKDLVQVDTYFATERANLNQNLLNELTQTANRLLEAGNRMKNNDLDEFKRRFSERWEEQEVPLLLALDNESGIGYGATGQGKADNLVLLKDLVIPRQKRSSTPMNWTNEARLRQAVYTRFLGQNRQSVELTEADIDSIVDPDRPNRFPASMYMFGQLLAGSTEALDRGDYTFVYGNLFGPTAANLLGRFCHGDPALAQSVNDLLRQEEASQPEAIFAEIVHLPEARTGNVLLRPQLRDYEIAYMGRSAAPDSHCIGADDLLVSIQNDEVVLRSKRLNRRIIPRLSTAHNFTQGIAVYRFLCDLQHQGYSQPFSWDWGVYRKEPHLPRISYQKFVLSYERWYLESKTYAKSLEKSPNPATFVAELRQSLGLPRWVVLHEGDNDLPLDLDCFAAGQILVDKLKKKDIILFEHLQTVDQCFVGDKNGTYCHELLFPLHVTTSTPVQPRLQAPVGTALPRQFMVGSEWLYVKLYGGNKTAERLLVEVIKPLAEEMLAQRQIDSWFFIRYADPLPHLRVRFHGDPNSGFWATLLTRLQAATQPYLDEGLLMKLQVDTYQREIERYGEPTMLLSETFFYHDSVAITDFLSLIEGDAGEQYRWQFALRNVDRLFDDFGYSLDERRALIDQIGAGFRAEFGGSPTLLHRLNDRYRAHRALVNQILTPEADTDEIEEAVACFEKRSLALKPMATHPLVQADRDRLMPSYIHMTLNRFFLSKQRQHELVIYHYLSKYYESQMARQKKGVLQPA
ncbi:hypothetical protein F5984_21945 [Rudanella paleaurantiibacter]|uniref:Lantibiotic dehydratase n=1 Tax=Rudanella paleaurantiibacter TaxID=2614655 RepID=A0A7J5TU19_9BACT|nr:lantibiotic dehydratase [Rudanella paleaurantiibacter]KAB7727293.1 hypothetical protein F5984_21945 [Rudanella paleaurantiibacter]